MDAILCIPGINPFVFLFLLQNQTAMEEIVKPDASGILYLGSSVIEIPLCLLDSRTTYSPKIEKAEKILAEELHEPGLKSRLLCVEGSLMSDQYLVIQRLAAAKEKPRLMILSVVPRDFYDTRFKSRFQSAGFRALASFSQIQEWQNYLSDPFQWCEAILDKSIWLYRFRTLVASEIAKQVNGYAYDLLPKTNTATVATNNSQNDFSRKADQALMDRSLKEYADVYKNIDKSAEYVHQIDFLKKTLSFASSSKIPLLLVGLPLTDANKKLLPSGFYDAYKESVKNAAATERIEFIDLDGRDLFTDSDFWDSGHLGLSGAKKLMTYLIPSIKKILNEQSQSK